MAIQLSPGINVNETDLTTVIPSGATSIGAFAGPFVWGPQEQITSISDENRLVEAFGKPNSNNASYWFSAANFLTYSNNLRVVRSSSANDKNASANSAAGVLIKNNTDYQENWSSGNASSDFAAKYAGDLGNSLAISICPNANSFEQNLASVLTIQGSVANIDTTITTTTGASTNIAVGDLIALVNTITGTVTTDFIEVTNVTTTTINISSSFGVTTSNSNTAIVRRWKYYSSFTDAPATSDYAVARSGVKDEMHIVVIDRLGQFSGVKNSILEKFAFVSKASDAKTSDGSSNYYANVLNSRSKYVWWMNNPKPTSNSGWGTVSSNTTFTEGTNYSYYSNFANGTADLTSTSGINSAYDLFGNSDTSDVSLMIAGPATSTVANYLIGIVDSRKDCLVFISPERSDVVDALGSEVTNILDFRTNLTSSSFAVMDSGWKYQYDKYNDTYTWVPLNGDIAGINARTDLERDPWYSPAGSSRGRVKNVVKLSWNPNQTDRDSLYLKGVNPVVTFAGEGTVLYGDKTLLSRPSAFDRINVRRLFIVLEKAISRAARSTLFEFNDQFTRAQFVSLVEPYLRDIKGRRGITDFRVVCDETNNTSDVIDRNEFVGDIYIKPSRSVNFIQLNFVAVRTGVNFEEITGRI